MGRTPWHRTEQEDDDDRIVAESMVRADIVELADRLYPTLSGGEQARTSFARLLAQATPVLMLDEPTAALDIRHQESLLAVAREAAVAGAGVVVVLHDLSLAAAYADRVCVLSHGAVRADGPPAEVLTSELLTEVYAHPVDVIEHAGEPAGRPGPREGRRSRGPPSDPPRRCSRPRSWSPPRRSPTGPSRSRRARVDPTYATTIQVSGSGFQSVKGGHGGIYVFFGTVSAAGGRAPAARPARTTSTCPTARPRTTRASRSTSRSRAPTPRARPNGGTMTSSGSWSTALVVPGADVQGLRPGRQRPHRRLPAGHLRRDHGRCPRRDQREQRDVHPDQGRRAQATAQPTETPTTSATADPTTAPSPSPSPARVGRRRRRPARLPSRSTGPRRSPATCSPSPRPACLAGVQVSAVFDDGAAGAGPFLVGTDGTPRRSHHAAGRHRCRHPRAPSVTAIDDPPSVQLRRPGHRRPSGRRRRAEQCRRRRRAARRLAVRRCGRRPAAGRAGAARVPAAGGARVRLIAWLPQRRW